MAKTKMDLRDLSGDITEVLSKNKKGLWIAELSRKLKEMGRDISPRLLLYYLNKQDIARHITIVKSYSGPEKTFLKIIKLKEN